MKNYRKTVLATALAIAGFGLAASAPANAGLLSISITDSNAGTTFFCEDNTACDSNSAPNQVTVNSTAANAALGSSVFDVNNIGASSNFAGGDPLSAIITASGGIVANQRAPGLTPLIIQISQTGWTKPTDLLRTLFQGPTAGFTNSGLGDYMLFHALSDQADLLFAGNPAFDPPNTNAAGLPALAADDFVTPEVRFLASGGPTSIDADCGTPAGQLQNCSGSSSLIGFNQTNTFSLTQRLVFQVGDSPVPNAFNRIDFTTALSEFSAAPNRVSEPGSIPLMGLGLMGLVAIARRKKV